MKIIETRKHGIGKRVYTRNDEPSKTDQSFAQEADVKNIMERYRKTGQITHLAKSQGLYADVSNIPDLNEALSRVQEAQYAFDQLPSDLRARFRNNPINMVDFLSDPKNLEEAQKLGLIPKNPTQLVEAEPTTSERKKTKTPKSTATIVNDNDSNDDDN